MFHTHHKPDLNETVFNTIKETMYPVEWCFTPDSTKTCWFEWLYMDPAYYYTTLSVVSAFQDIYIALGEPFFKPTHMNLSSRFSKQTNKYLEITISLLQQNLEDSEKRIQDVTISVVVSLIMLADAVGDAETCKMHINGLKQMIQMRGGIKAMRENRQVLAKVYR